MLSINNSYDYSEREMTVLELYKQGKSTRNIAKELRMSLRDISIILRKNQASHGIEITGNDINNYNNSNNNNKSPDEKATQAYKLFSEGKKLVEVSIDLGLREKEASKLFSEFLRLKGQDEVYEIYFENKHYLKSLRKIHRVIKREGVTADRIEWFVNMVMIGAYKIPELQKKYVMLKDEVEIIDERKVMSKHELDKMNNHITYLQRNLYQLSADCNYKSNEFAYLQCGVRVLEGQVNRLNSQHEIENETYS
jgi:Mor family transcriptional regulator